MASRRFFRLQRNEAVIVLATTEILAASTVPARQVEDRVRSDREPTGGPGSGARRRSSAGG
jgi:hypothetical protein